MCASGGGAACVDLPAVVFVVDDELAEEPHDASPDAAARTNTPETLPHARARA